MTLNLPKTEGRFNAMCEGGTVITPNDSTDLARFVTGLNVSTSGPVKVTMLDGSIVTLQLAAGVIHRLIVKRVYATDTNAGTIYGMY